VTCGLFTRDGRLLVTGGEDGSVRVWAPKTGACSKVYELGEAPVTALVTSPADAAIVCATTMEGYARVINLASQRVVLSVDHNDKEDKEGSVVEAGGGGGVAGEDEEDSTSVERCVAARAPAPAPHTFLFAPLCFGSPWLTPFCPPPLLRTFPRDVCSAAFCAVQPWLASGATNGSVVISDLSSNTARHRLSMGGGGRNGKHT
jgi:WD40 repeat protein